MSAAPGVMDGGFLIKAQRALRRVSDIAESVAALPVLALLARFTMRRSCVYVHVCVCGSGSAL